MLRKTRREDMDRVAHDAQFFDKRFDAYRHAVYDRRVAIRKDRDSQRLLRVSAVSLYEIDYAGQTESSLISARSVVAEPAAVGISANRCGANAKQSGSFLEI